MRVLPGEDMDILVMIAQHHKMSNKLFNQFVNDLSCEETKQFARELRSKDVDSLFVKEMNGLDRCDEYRYSN